MAAAHLLLIAAAAQSLFFLVYSSCHRLVVATLAVLVDIETFFLDSLVNTQTGNLLDAPEEDDTCYGCPKVDAEDTEALSTEESEATTIEGATIKGEETSHQGTEDTTNTMY